MRIELVDDCDELNYFLGFVLFDMLAQCLRDTRHAKLSFSPPWLPFLPYSSFPNL